MATVEIYPTAYIEISVRYLDKYLRHKNLEDYFKIGRLRQSKFSMYYRFFSSFEISVISTIGTRPLSIKSTGERKEQNIDLSKSVLVWSKNERILSWR